MRARRLLSVVITFALVAGMAGVSGPPTAGAQLNPVEDGSFCSTLYGFATQPVPVAKTIYHDKVLASVEWSYSAEHNLCYLVLDDVAVRILRANPPAGVDHPSTELDEAAAERCHNAHNPERGFAADPVPVAKSADGKTVLASVKWGHSQGLCYLILDQPAHQALLAHHPCTTNAISLDCDEPTHIVVVRSNLLWSPDGWRTAYVDQTFINDVQTETIYVAD